MYQFLGADYETERVLFRGVWSRRRLGGQCYSLEWLTQPAGLSCYEYSWASSKLTKYWRRPS